MSSETDHGRGAGRTHLQENPFFVLGLDAGQPRAAIEREGQKLLGMLAVGLDAATTYETPFGPRPRTPELVRWALAELRQPERRLFHELWAAAPTSAPASSASPASVTAAAAAWPEARAIYGWERRR